MVSQITSSFDMTGICRPLYLIEKTLDESVKALIHACSVFYGISEASKAPSIVKTLLSIGAYAIVMPYTIDGFSSIVNNLYLNNCVPETMASIEGRNIEDLTHTFNN